MKSNRIKKGDVVKMNNMYYVSKKEYRNGFTVISDPQKVCGSTCVWLDGYRGCYAIDGLEKVGV